LVSNRVKDIEKTKKIFLDLKKKVEKNRLAFSNSNMVRMREAIRYLSPDKLEIFIKIPFLLHINSPGYPGFTDSEASVHGIWNFLNSRFYKEAANQKLFPRSIIESVKNDTTYILGLYHIGSLGTFTQSKGSDFDFWVMIDKKKFSKQRLDCFQNKLDAILKYCRDAYQQEVTFFVIDQKYIKSNNYSLFDDPEILDAPRIFLKEEFYRTFLMIAGKIPAWCVLPDFQDIEKNLGLNRDGITAQILSMYDDLIDLGHVSAITMEDVLKGLLWHICKSEQDPVKAIIKATRIFSYGFGRSNHKVLLCDRIKEGYARAGIDDFSADPYKLLFDQILEFHEKEDPKGLNLIKNAIFFRLCEYPDIKIPDHNTPKRNLLEKYILLWKLNQNQVGKLLSYPSWSESEKLLLEKAFLQRLAYMYNYAIKETEKKEISLDFGKEKRNWVMLKNKIRMRLNKNTAKIPECSTYLKRKRYLQHRIIKKKDSWILNSRLDSIENMDNLYRHPNLLGVMGWILENHLYNRYIATLSIESDLKLFESIIDPVDPEKLYMSFQPLKPLSDKIFEQGPIVEKILVLVSYRQEDGKNMIRNSEFLISNTWGELFFNEIKFSSQSSRQEQCRQMAELIAGYSKKKVRLYIYQYSTSHDPEIVYELKKAYCDIAIKDQDKIIDTDKKPYLDKL